MAQNAKFQEIQAEIQAELVGQIDSQTANIANLKAQLLKIGKRVFKYWKSREIEGKIKTVTIKRNPLGEIFIFVVTDYQDHQVTPMTVNSAGFDFGINVFLSCSDSTEFKSQLFIKKSIKQLIFYSSKN